MKIFALTPLFQVQTTQSEYSAHAIFAWGERQIILHFFWGGGYQVCTFLHTQTFH